MTKRCPIMSKQNENHSKIYCFENECAFWDEEKEQCCIKSAMIAVAGNKGGSTPFPQAIYEQALYIPPTAIPNPNTNNPYTIVC